MVLQDTVQVASVASEWPSVASVITALIAAAVALWSLWFQRRSERWAVNRAILAEISRLLDVINQHREWWIRQSAAGDTNLPLMPFTIDVYDKLAGNLGSLYPKVVVDVVRFYGYVRFVNNFQQSRSEHVAEGKGGEFDTAYGKLLKKLLDAFHDAFEAEFSRYRVSGPKYPWPSQIPSAPPASPSSPAPHE
jgi:hypothetical protein